MVDNAAQKRTWWGNFTAKYHRVKKGLSSDRQRWIYIRTSYTNELTSEFYGGEFDKLCKDWRVANMVVSEQGTIVLTTIPVIKTIFYNGWQYTLYLGTYEVHVELAAYFHIFGRLAIPPTTNFKVVCIHSGRYSGKLETTYPINTAHGFCLGKRQKYAEQLADSGEFYAFFTLLLDSLWHINPMDKQRFVNEFRKVGRRDDSELHKPQSLKGVADG